MMIKLSKYAKNQSTFFFKKINSILSVIHKRSQSFFINFARS